MSFLRTLNHFFVMHLRLIIKNWIYGVVVEYPLRDREVYSPPESHQRLKEWCWLHAIPHINSLSKVNNASAYHRVTPEYCRFISTNIGLWPKRNWKGDHVCRPCVKLSLKEQGLYHYIKTILRWALIGSRCILITMIC